MTLHQQFTAQYPDAFFLEDRESSELRQLLISHGWVSSDELFQSIGKPGEGNMNVVIRVRTDRQTFILKQARPWVQKYPQVPAPMERIGVEAQFYQRLAQEPSLSSFSPRLIGYDADNFLLAMEDLGEGIDYTYLYQPDQRLLPADVEPLMQFLSTLHSIRASEAPNFPDNRAMRLLNHEHIFNFPYRLDTGFDLDTVQPGLQALSMPYKTNHALKQKVAQLGEIYLQPGSTLIHGDYYPGSWLKVADGTKVIDPEFGFFGQPEFDLGVMLAHLKMAQQDTAVQQQVLNQYQAPADFKPALLRAFIGTEILRRLLGLAQLPLSLDLMQKQALLEEAASLVLETV